MGSVHVGRDDKVGNNRPSTRMGTVQKTYARTRRNTSSSCSVVEDDDEDDDDPFGCLSCGRTCCDNQRKKSINDTNMAEVEVEKKIGLEPNKRKLA